MSSTTDKLKGTANQVAGKVKQGVGEATDDPALKGEGKDRKPRATCKRPSQGKTPLRRRPISSCPRRAKRRGASRRPFGCAAAGSGSITFQLQTIGPPSNYRRDFPPRRPESFPNCLAHLGVVDVSVIGPHR